MVAATDRWPHGREETGKGWQWRQGSNTGICLCDFRGDFRCHEHFVFKRLCGLSPWHWASKFAFRLSVHRASDTRDSVRKGLQKWHCFFNKEMSTLHKIYCSSHALLCSGIVFIVCAYHSTLTVPSPGHPCSLKTCTHEFQKLAMGAVRRQKGTHTASLLPLGTSVHLDKEVALSCGVTFTGCCLWWHTSLSLKLGDGGLRDL